MKLFYKGAAWIYEQRFDLDAIQQTAHMTGGEFRTIVWVNKYRYASLGE